MGISRSAGGRGSSGNRSKDGGLGIPPPREGLAAGRANRFTPSLAAGICEGMYWPPDRGFLILALLPWALGSREFGADRHLCDNAPT
jgi:hypothetical protein